MSQFYASIEGNRGVATRQGTKRSGIQGHIRGWHTGARVDCYHDEQTGQDIVRVFRTGGSQRPSGHLIASWVDDKPTVYGEV